MSPSQAPAVWDKEWEFLNFLNFEVNNCLCVYSLRELAPASRCGAFTKSSRSETSGGGLCGPAARMGSYTGLQASSFRFAGQEQKRPGPGNNALRNPKCCG